MKALSVRGLCALLPAIGCVAAALVLVNVCTTLSWPLREAKMKGAGPWPLPCVTTKSLVEFATKPVGPVTPEGRLEMVSAFWLKPEPATPPL